MNVLPGATDSLPYTRFLSGAGHAFFITTNSLSQAYIGDHRCVVSKYSHGRTAERGRSICVGGRILHVEVMLVESQAFDEMTVGFGLIRRQVFRAKFRLGFPIRMCNRFDQLTGEFNDFSFMMSCVRHERKSPYEDS
jgi:hypothetical protein